VGGSRPWRVDRLSLTAGAQPLPRRGVDRGVKVGQPRDGPAVPARRHHAGAASRPLCGHAGPAGKAAGAGGGGAVAPDDRPGAGANARATDGARAAGGSDRAVAASERREAPVPPGCPQGCAVVDHAAASRRHCRQLGRRSVRRRHRAEPLPVAHWFGGGGQPVRLAAADAIRSPGPACLRPWRQDRRLRG